MPNPKRRFSNSRTRKRRTHDKLTPPVIPLAENIEKRQWYTVEAVYLFPLQAGKSTTHGLS